MMDGLGTFSLDAPGQNVSHISGTQGSKLLSLLQTEETAMYTWLSSIQ